MMMILLVFFYYLLLISNGSYIDTIVILGSNITKTKSDGSKKQKHEQSDNHVKKNPKTSQTLLLKEPQP